MDYFNFIAECQGLSTYSAKTIQILTSVNSLISEYSRAKEQLLKNLKISLNNLILEIDKPINSIYKLKYVSFFEKNLLKIINSFKEVLTKESRENDLLDSEICSPLNSFIKHINSQNNLIFNEFKILTDEIYKQKKKCDLSKDNYMKSGKQITLVAEKLSSISDENSTEAKELNNNLNILKTKFQKYYIEYKENVNNTNKLYAEKNKKYFSYIFKVKEIEDSKESFMNFYFEKFDNYLKNRLNILTTFKSVFKDVIPNEENEKEIKKRRNAEFSEQLNNFVYDVEKQIRMKNEEFIEYETYKKQLSALIKQNRMYLKEDTKNNRINFNPKEILINTIDSTTSSSFKKDDREYIFNKEENILIEKIFLIDEIDSFKADQLANKIKTNFDYAQNIIDKVLERYTSSIGVQILNENNFAKFGKMINGVLLNEEIQKNLFEINLAIIYISEKTFYQREDNPFYKKYLCKFLSDINRKIRTKEYWIKLLSIKIARTLEQEADIKSKKIFNEEKKKEMAEQKNKEKVEVKNKNEDKNNDKKRKKFFGFNLGFGKDNDEKSLEEKERKEKDLSRMKEIFNEVYNKISSEVAIRLIQDCIVHFSCFCVESYDVIDIIAEISNKFKIIEYQKL